MTLRSLRSKLLVAASTLVIGSGLLIAILVTHRYTDSLYEAVASQADSLAHAVALESVDKILINDMVALQKMLEHQMRSNPSIAYLFILKEGRILAHTFPAGVPAELIDVNRASSTDSGHEQRVKSLKGDHYVDIAWPIFGGKAGTLRLGFSEKPLWDQVTRLWLQISLATVLVLLLAVGGGLVFVRRITRPLSALVQATQRIDQGDLDVRVDVPGHDEVASLASSFNTMMSRLRDYTCRLELKAKELERSHNQTRTFCEIVREIGSLPSLHEIGPALIKRFQSIVVCQEMALLVFTEDRNGLFVLSERDARLVRDAAPLRIFSNALEHALGPAILTRSPLTAPLVPASFKSFRQETLIPLLSETGTLGGLVIACPGSCTCDLKEAEVVGMILSQAAGVLKRAVAHEESMLALTARIEASAEFCGIIGKNPKMQVVYRLIEDISPTDSTVLVQGESGTGKELVARAIHQQSERNTKPFVVINCSAYPDTLLESELFGHEKGAFTGAVKQRSGRFEQAHGGTVFLDEIGEIPPQAQVKLLRVLQTQSFERVGGEQSLRIDVRIIAATNKDLNREVQKGTFREDLFYRLNVIPIHVPPLRERPNDIPLLAHHFLKRFAAERSRDIQEVSSEALRMILEHPWPGNVRELENAIEHAVVLAKGKSIQGSDLPPALRAEPQRGSLPASVTMFVESERALLEHVLAECGWNKKEAARRLGIGRTTLYAKMRKYKIGKATLQ